MSPVDPDLRSRAFLDASDPVVLEDRDGRILDLNAEAERVYGWSRAELVGTPASALVPPRQREDAEDRVQRCWRGQSVRNEPGFRRSKSGAVYPVLVSMTVLEEAGEPLALAAVTRHATPLRPAEAELRRSEERYRSLVGAILDTAVEGILTIDEKGIVESINPAAQEMFGYAADEVVGRNVSLLMPSPYREEHDGYVARFLETGEKKIIGIGRTVQGQRKDGAVFPLYLAVSEVRLGEQRIFTGFVRDITELRQAQEQLVHSERLAGIGEMITGLAHESRNALQRMQACLEMLALEVEGRPDALSYVRRIQEAQDYLTQLYEEVRNYAAPIQLARKRCDLRRLWGAAWADLELAHRPKGLVLEDRTGGADVTCDVDPFALGQVFRNVFENAIAVCEKNGRIAFTCEDAGGELSLTVNDDGPGLAADQRDRIFQPFFSTKTQGTGLGMAIVERILEAHGGRVAVGSGPLPGAAIVITLPRGSA